jgi:hypothetical protein
MGQVVARELIRAERLLDGELAPAGVIASLELLGASRDVAAVLADSDLYNDYLPKAAEVRPTQRQRALHLLWDAFDMLPLSVAVDFAIPFRRMIAERLFRRCVANFIADEGVRFNCGRLLEVGDDVFFNRGAFFDTKGGVTIDDAAASPSGWSSSRTATASLTTRCVRTRR